MLFRSPMQMEVDGDSLVFPVPVCTRAALTQVVDLCAGMGGFTAVIDRLGFHAKAGVDHNGIWRGLYQSLHEGATFHAGDLMDSVVLRELLGQGLFHGIVCSGIACQPHSVLGDRRGMSDPRAESLPKSLHLGWLLQAAVLILECTLRFCEMLRHKRCFDSFVLPQGTDSPKASSNWETHGAQIGRASCRERV